MNPQGKCPRGRYPTVPYENGLKAIRGTWDWAVIKMNEKMSRKDIPEITKIVVKFPKNCYLNHIYGYTFTPVPNGYGTGKPIRKQSQSDDQFMNAEELEEFLIILPTAQQENVNPLANQVEEEVMTEKKQIAYGDNVEGEMEGYEMEEMESGELDMEVGELEELESEEEEEEDQEMEEEKSEEEGVENGEVEGVEEETTGTARIEGWIIPKSVPRPKAPFKIKRPNFTFFKLVVMAMLNSPTGKVRVLDVVMFVLHHFRFFRYESDNWRSSIRRELRTDKFTGEPHADNDILFSLKEPLSSVRDGFYSFKNRMYILKDPRGEQFYKRILNGEVGLPRPLFYRVVALNLPWFAGPENSAIFYHMISMKQLFLPFTTLFREYGFREHTGKEPCHTQSSKDSYGESGEVAFWDEEKVNLFHDNVDEYLELQQTYAKFGIRNFATPEIGHVEKVLSGKRKSQIGPMRRPVPVGSLYWAQ